MKTIKMTLKIVLGLAITMFGVDCGRAQTPSASAIPEWRVTVKVVDEQDAPVTNATVKVAWHIPPPADAHIAMTNVTGRTGGNGIFAVSQRSGSIEVLCGAEKVGYYSAGRTHEFQKFKESDPDKWNPTIRVLLKKIGTPIPMYAKSLNTHVPALDKAVGFDLMAGDWVSPYGKGIHPDFLFTGHLDKRDDGESDFTLTVGFPNPGDGIQVFTLSEFEMTSSLRSPHEAPPTGYQPHWIQTDNRKPGKPVETDRDPNRNYFFRVRTVLDENGNVKTALYGKIYGDFMQFRYYLNPTPNDRNVEFDPAQNLLKGAAGEVVNMP
jgi:hypothetical protein